MTWADGWTVVLAAAGALFLTVGTVGLLRLDDLHSRIHALTKADTLGLGLIVLALLPHAGSVGAAATMLLVWALALVSAAVIAHLLARGVEPRGLAEEGEPTSRRPDDQRAGPDDQRAGPDGVGST